MRLSTWTATSTSVARRSSVCARNRSPITCFHRPMAASARARFVYPDAFCQALRPRSAMCWRWRSRCVGSLSAVSLGTAGGRGGPTTAPPGGGAGGRLALGRLTGQGGRAGRHDNGRLGVALGDAGVNPVLIVRAIARERGHRPRHLIEQGIGLGAVIDVVGGQPGGDDLAGVS